MPGNIMNEPRTLIDKYLAGKCTAEERAQLLAHFNRYFDQQRDVLTPDALSKLNQLTWNAIDEQVCSLENTAPTDKSRLSRAPRRVLRWLPYAAAILLAVSATWYIFPDRKTDAEDAMSTVDIAPGGNRATLILANGRTIDLSEAQTGIVVDHNRIVYKEEAVAIASLNPTDIHELRLTTPNGGTYQVTLPDGTSVWLNAASTLTYPSVFSEHERIVTLSGEGYFEVAPDADTPFKVRSMGQLVEVLGTTFNISAYPDENETSTTLVEGSVRITSSGKARGEISLLLSPSEKATLKSGLLSKRAVDIDSDVAWRKGLFAFRSERLESIIRKVARWYDVDVELRGDISDHTFTGTVSRYENISGVLETLALTGLLSFEMEEGKLVVKSK